MATHHRRRASTWCCSFSPPPASPDRKFPIKSPAHSSNPNPNPSPSPNPNPNPRPFLSRRILSPGRVSPIDSDQIATDLAAVADPTPAPASLEESSLLVSEDFASDFKFELKGKDGRRFVVELMDRGVLCQNSEFFRSLIENDTTIIDVDNVDLYKDAIELIELDEKDLMMSIVEKGILHAIDLLEVKLSLSLSLLCTNC
jgi:hypothetical protein